MKNIYIIIIISLFAAIACNDDYLDKYPLDKINDAIFWNSATDIQMYANQFYFDLKPGERYFERDFITDNAGPATRIPYVWSESIVPSSGEGWAKTDWQKIRRCNYALTQIKGMQVDAQVSIYEAEIRFFKSFYYFEKVTRYGEVPWFEDVLQTDSEDLYRGRDTRQTVIANMIEDLDFAIDNLPGTSAADRLTKYAALALKVDVCLYEGTFRKYHGLGNYQELLVEAANASEMIINSTLFSVYSTGKPDKDYFDLFIQYELKGNKEGIMVQRYLKDKRMHNLVLNMIEQTSGYTKDFVESYLCTDGLPISLSPLYNGDAVFADEFINRDPRMKQSIYTSDRPFFINQSNGAILYKAMPEFLATRCYTSYYMLKGFSPYSQDQFQSQCVIDKFIFRYANVLLSYAEAKAELEECTQEVLDISINKLRDRVGMPHLSVDVGFVDPNWPNWEVPVTPLINEIRRERRIETCCEGTRWDDLVRWKAGKLLENPLTLAGARDPATGNYRVLYPGKTRLWNNKLYLYPLPTQEIVLNPKLEQNPGWND